MLVELPNIAQIAGEPRRRWFSSKYFDVVVWLSAGQEVLGFQVCYAKEAKEKALEWRCQGGWRHYSVDTGEDYKFHLKESPVMLIDGPIDINGICERFEDESREIDSQISAHILSKLCELAIANEA